MIRAVSFAMLLSGCGLIAGLRTDYELSEAGSAADGGEGGSDARPDAAPSCTDMIKNGVETDIDCGGGVCPKCGVNKTCTDNKDCLSDNCSANKCRP